jgi:hypothetical protein
MTKTYYHLHTDGLRVELIKLEDGKKILGRLHIPTLESQIKEMGIKGECVPLMEKDIHIKETEK